MGRVLSLNLMSRHLHGQPQQARTNPLAWSFCHGCPRFNTLAEGTVRGTISNVVQTFQSLGRQNPTKDTDNKLSILLSRQFRAFRNDDPKEKQQKALLFAVLDELTKCQVTETDKSITQFTIGAAFCLQTIL